MRHPVAMLSGVDADVARFSRLFGAFLHQMEAAAEAGATSPFKETLDTHLGADCRAMPAVTDAHVNSALDELLSGAGRSPRR